MSKQSEQILEEKLVAQLQNWATNMLLLLMNQA